MKRCYACNAHFNSSLIECPSCGVSPVVSDGFRAYAPEFAHGGGGFKSTYFSDLAILEKTNFWFQSRNSLILWGLKKYFPSLSSMMEVGCGTGFVLSGVSEVFPSAQLVGSEIFVAGLHYASQRIPRAEFVQMDARRIPYESEFDMIGAFDVIEHIKEDMVVLQSMFNAIKPGGGLMVTVPQHQWLWSGADDYACHERRYSSADLHAKLQDNGFEIIRSTSFVSLLLPAMILSRMRSSNEQKFDVLDEFRINPAINWIFKSVMSVERVIIQLGINIPFGGSRLVVARRPF